MAHEITSTDGLVLHKEKAWHGLGTIVEDAPTPDEALKIANLDWLVLQTKEVYGVTSNASVKSDKWQLNYRSDTKEVLGCVTSGYQPIQNYELAKFCEQLSMDTVVKVESAGSLFGGKRLWFLLKADTFDLGKNGREDPVVPYVLVSNGHDGSLSFSARPTSVRVVCNNTLSWAMQKKSNVFSLRHTQNILSRVGEARDQMQAYLGGLTDFKSACNHLRDTTVSREDLQKFFHQMYCKCVEPIPTEPKNEDEERIVVRATKGIWEVCTNFDTELGVAGQTYWNAFNASSRWLQTRQKSRSEDTRNFNKVMGAANDNTTKAFNLALAEAK